MPDIEPLTLLLIEDDSTIGELLSYNLEEAGYRVLRESDGRSGLHAALTYDVSLVILDVMLPQLDGIAVCREVKRRRPNLPVILLTSRTDPETLVEGFGVGADDYVTKPFKVVELLARIRKRHVQLGQDPTVNRQVIGPSLCAQLLDSDTYCLRGKTAAIPLQPKEHDLLFVLASEAGRLFTREELTQRVWHQEYLGGSRTLDVRVKHLREKLKEGQTGLSIQAIRGVGYRLAEMEEPQ